MYEIVGDRSLQEMDKDLSIARNASVSQMNLKKMDDAEFTVTSSSGPRIDNYWNRNIDKFEDNSPDGVDSKKNTPAWKKGALVLLLMPKGSLIFAPILFKKVFGANSLDFSQLDYSLLAIKAAASFALWMCYRTYKTTKDLQLHITPLVPVVKNQVEKAP